MMLGRLGDWFAPSCTPGTLGCDPHWYCSAIPLAMATPDCAAALGAALGGATDAAGAAAGEAAGSFLGGLTSSLGGTLLLGAAIIGGFWYLSSLKPTRGRRR